MFVVIVVYFRRRISVMNKDLANRTGQHKYCSDSSEVNNDTSLANQISPEFSPETIANNPMYVVNFSPGNQDKNINIIRENISLSKIPNRETRDVNQQPLDDRWEKSLFVVIVVLCTTGGNNHCLLTLLFVPGSCPR